MKIDRAKTKPGATLIPEMPPDIKAFIETIKTAITGEDLIAIIHEFRDWPFKKTDLFFWFDVLDRFDTELHECAKKPRNDNSWVLNVDLEENTKMKQLLLDLLNFSTMLVKHCTHPGVYNSVDNLTELLNSTDLNVVTAVLDLLHALTDACFAQNVVDLKSAELCKRLNYLSESWGGKVYGVSLAECAQEMPIVPPYATTLHFEFNQTATSSIVALSTSKSAITPTDKITIHIENVPVLGKQLAELMNDLVTENNIPSEYHQQLYTRLRLITHFGSHNDRKRLVYSRLCALFINALSSESNGLVVTPSLIEETTAILFLEDNYDIKEMALNTLRSFTRITKLKTIVNATGANLYHGFIPKLTRDIINYLTSSKINSEQEYPTSFITSLFSFQLSLTTIDAGRQALTQCGLVEQLLKFIQWKGYTLQNLHVVTQAVRIISSLTSRDMLNFQTHNGLDVMAKKLQYEVNICRVVNPFEIRVIPSEKQHQETAHGDIIEKVEDNSMQVEEEVDTALNDLKKAGKIEADASTWSSPNSPPNFKCTLKRVELIEALIDLLRKLAQYPALSDATNTLISSDEFLLNLKHLISNPEFYGNVIFAYTIDLVSLYIHGSPALLTAMQNKGLSGVILSAIFDPDRKIPLCNEFSTAMSNVLTALCLNQNGLQAFVGYKPFDKLFTIFTQVEYMPRLMQQTNYDYATNHHVDNTIQLGKAMDQLIRHQPTLKVPCLNTMVRTLEQLASLGEDKRYIIKKESFSRNSNGNVIYRQVKSKSARSDQQEEIPLLDYIINMMRFVQIIINASPSHSQEFIRQQGLPVLHKLLTLPNLPVTFGNSVACCYCAEVLYYLFKNTHDKNIFLGILEKLTCIMAQQCDPILQDCLKLIGDANQQTGPSVLLYDMARNTIPDKWHDSELWRSISMVFTLISVLHSCYEKNLLKYLDTHGTVTELRAPMLELWATPLGQGLIVALSKFHVMFVWEYVTMSLSLTENFDDSQFPVLKNQLDRVLETTKLSRATAVYGHELGLPMDVDFSIEQSTFTQSAEISSTSTQSATEMCRIAEIKKLISPAMDMTKIIYETVEKLFQDLLKFSVTNPPSFHRRSALAQQLVVPSSNARILAKNLNVLPRDSMKTTLDKDVPAKYCYKYYKSFLRQASSILTDTLSNPYQLILQNFAIEGAQDALFDLFERLIAPVVKQFSVSEVSVSPDVSLPDGFEEFLEAWIDLIACLSNSTKILETPHPIPGKSNDAILVNSTFVGFEPMEFIIRIHRQMYKPVAMLWNADHFLSKLQSNLIGRNFRISLLMLITDIFRAAPLVSSYVSKRDAKSTPIVASVQKSTTEGNSTLISQALGRPALAGVSAFQQEQTPSDTAAAPVDQVASSHTRMLQTLVDMGFSRTMAADALIQTEYDVIRAADWLLSNPLAFVASSSGASVSAGNDFEMTEAEQLNAAISMSLQQEAANTSLVLAPPLVALSPNSLSTPTMIVSTIPNTSAESQNVLTEPLVNEKPLRKRQFDQLQTTLQQGIILFLDTNPSDKDIYKCAESLSAIYKAGFSNVFSTICAELVSQIVSVGQRILSQVAFISEDAAKTGDLSSKLSPEPDATELKSRAQFLLLISNQSKGTCLNECVKLDLYRLVVDLIDRAAKLMTLAGEHKQKIETPKWLCPVALWLDVYEKYAIGRKRRSLLLTQSTGRTWKAFQDRSVRWNSYDSNTNRLIDDAFRSCETAVRYTADGNRKYTVQLDSMIQHSETTHSKRPITFVTKEIKDHKKSKSSLSSKANTPIEETTVKLQSEPEVESQLPHVGKDIIRSIVALVKIPVLDSSTLNAIMRIALRITYLDHSAASEFAELGGISALLNLKKQVEFPGINSITLLIIRHVFEDEKLLSNVIEREIRLAVASPNLPTEGAPISQEMYSVLRTLSSVADRNSSLFKELAKKNLKINLLNKPFAENLEDRTPSYLELAYPTSERADEELSVCAKGVITELLNMIPIKFLEETATGQDKQSDANETEKPCFSASILLSLLPELIKSYQSIAKLICDHSYQRGFTDQITEDCSALSFILDHMLSSPDTLSPPMMVFKSLASIYSSATPMIHQVIVIEIKNALHRALHNDNCLQKHTRIEVMATLLLQVIESCPKSIAEGAQPTRLLRHMAFNSNQLAIIRVMAKCGLVNDLARCAQALDLSSARVSKALDAFVKTLEVISETLIYVPKNRTISANVTASDAATGRSSTQVLATIQDGQHSGDQVPPPSSDVVRAPGAMEDYDLDPLVPPTAVSQTSPQRIRSRRVDAPGDEDEVSDGASILDEEMSRENETLDDEEDETHHHVIDHYEDDDAEEEGEEEGEDEEDEEYDEEEEMEDDFDAIAPPDLHGDDIDYRDSFLASQWPLQTIRDSFALDDTSLRFNSLPSGTLAAHPMLTSAQNVIPSSQPSAAQAGFLQLPPGARIQEVILQFPRNSRRYNDIVNAHGDSIRILPRRGRETFNLGRDDLNALRNSRAGASFQLFSTLFGADDPRQVNSFRTPFGSNPSSLSSSIGISLSTSARWTEVCRQLNGEFFYDALLGVQGEIISYFELMKNQALKKKRDEEEAKVAKVALATEISAKEVATSNETNQDVAMTNVEAESTSQTAEPVPQLVDTNDQQMNEVPAELTASTTEVVTTAEASLSTGPVSETLGGDTDQPMNEAPSPSTGVTASQAPTNESLPIDEFAAAVESFSEIAHVSVHASSSAPTTELTTPQLTPELRAILGDIQIPEGIDPSYLAALPQDIRQEVIAEQLRIQRLSQQQQTAPATTQQDGVVASGASGASTSGAASNEISPEFLAALPPDIRQEVLAQQRAEQVENAPNVQAPIDPDGFIRTLPPTLRRQVLSDMDDSQVQLLANDLATEARTLRREHAIRRENAFIEEYMVEIGNNVRQRHGAASIAAVIDNAAARFSRRGIIPSMPIGVPMRGIRAITGHPSSTNHYSSTWNGVNSAHSTYANYHSGYSRTAIKGKHLLDHESLSSLLILLFTEDSMANHSRLHRLHRLIRNVCFHGPTRQFIIASLLEFVERAKLASIERKTQSIGKDALLKLGIQNLSVSWPSIAFESAFGAKTKVFHLDSSRLSTFPGECNPMIFIHPEAASFICCKVFDILIYLAKTFPDDFSSTSTKEPTSVQLSSTITLELNQDINSSLLSANSNSATKKSQHGQSGSQSIFDVMLHHDSIHGNKKAKGSSKHHHGSNVSLNLSDLTESSISSAFDIQSPFLQLLNLLSQPFINKTSSLSDKLIRLLSCSLSNSARIPSPLFTNATEADEIANENRVLSVASSKYAPLEKGLEKEGHLQLLVNFLTSTTCSEEGLADAHSLMIKLSTIFPSCREIFYQELLQAARNLGYDVLRDIEALIEELSTVVTLSEKKPIDDLSIPGTSSSIHDRYDLLSLAITGNRNSKKAKSSGKEIHLPTMSTLASKNSSQHILLRIIDIVVEIRELVLRDKVDREKVNLKTAATAVRRNSGDATDAVADIVPEGEPLQELITANSRSSMITQTDVNIAMKLNANDAKLSEELSHLKSLWEKLSECLDLLQESRDDRSVLVLEPTVEAFFLVHATEALISRSSNITARANQASDANESTEDILDRSSSQLPSASPVTEDVEKFLSFAERHRFVVNQILRQSTIHLSDSTFSFLVDHAHIIDFDVKRRYFREELKRMDHGALRRGLSLHINRSNVFESSFGSLDRLSPEEWKGLFRISFEGEEGQDAGGLLREWYCIIARDIFNPNYALFTHSSGDNVTYTINQSSYYNSNHLNYFRFVGRLIGKAIYENQLLDCYFTRSFYKHMLGKPVRYTDMEAEDNEFMRGLVYLLEHNVADVGTEMYFSLEIQEFGITKICDLKPDGRNIIVTEENKKEYVRLICQEKMTGSIKQQLKSFLGGFYEIVPKRLISIFNEHELELLISGLPDIDIDDLQANTEYHKYNAESLQIQWFWRALRTFENTDRVKLLQFVTGTSKVPLQGFAALGDGLKFKIYRDDRSTDRLPCAHTCFNQLDLPLYETYEKLREMLLKAIQECGNSHFGFA